MIKVKINIRRDAWNWWNAGNKVSYGVDWKKRLPSKIQRKIVGRGRLEAYEFLLPYLRKLYKKLNIAKIKNEVNELFGQKQEAILRRMEKVTGRKIYQKEFVFFLTTFPRGPYNFQKGHIWLPVIWSKVEWLLTFVHELLHFQTYAYWEKFCLKHVTKEQFEDLKESLTVVLNDDFADLIKAKDHGYERHKELRIKLLKFWRKDKNFDRLVRYGVGAMENN